MNVWTVVFLVLIVVLLVGSGVAYWWRYDSLREEFSLREFVVAYPGCLVLGATFIGGTPADWLDGKVEVKLLNCGLYLVFLMASLWGYISIIRSGTRKRRSSISELKDKIKELEKNNEDFKRSNTELHNSLHNYFHPHLADLYKFFFEYGNGTTPPTFDWGYRRLNLFLYDAENESILNLSRYCSVTDHDIPRNRFVGFNPKQSYVAKIFNVRNQHTGHFYELDSAWKEFRPGSRALDRIKYVCGYEIPIRGSGTARKSLLILFEFENLPSQFIHQNTAKLLQSYIDNSKFPRSLFKGKSLSSLSTLVNICKNWPSNRRSSELELADPTFRFRNGITLGNAPRARANKLTP